MGVVVDIPEPRAGGRSKEAAGDVLPRTLPRNSQAPGTRTRLTEQPLALCLQPFNLSCPFTWLFRSISLCF